MMSKLPYRHHRDVFRDEGEAHDGVCERRYVVGRHYGARMKPDVPDDVNRAPISSHNNHLFNNNKRGGGRKCTM